MFSFQLMIPMKFTQSLGRGVSCSLSLIWLLVEVWRERERETQRERERERIFNSVLLKTGMCVCVCQNFVLFNKYFVEK